MIFIWIREAFFWLLRLVIPPPEYKKVRTIDPNVACPNCGHGQGKLTAVIKDQKMQCQHDCLICKAQWWEDPVLQSYEPIAASSAAIKVDAPHDPAPLMKGA
jgi:hypothetical protein